MIIKTSHFNKQILKSLKKKDPVLYKNIRIQDINTIVTYMMKNANLCICRKQDIYFTNYFSCHTNKVARWKKIIRNLPEI
jgi:uncharacterized protein (UPF0305 family)